MAFNRSYDDTWSRLCLVCLVCMGLACVGPNQVAESAPRVLFADLAGDKRAQAFQKLSDIPVVLAFAAGDRVPVKLVLDSTFIELVAPDFMLVAKRDFYVLLRRDGPPLLSEDGVEFEAHPKNTFLLGFDVGKRRATRLRMGLGLWPARPSGAP
jgi:hypothetical protein